MTEAVVRQGLKMPTYF